MNNLILHLNGSIIQALGSDQPTTAIQLGGVKYFLEEQYFGDWIPLRDESKKIVGFKLVPLVGDDYLEQFFLTAGFVRLARNLRVEKSVNTYFTIYLADRDTYTDDRMNRIEAAVLRSASGEIAIRLDGFTKEEVEQFGFKVE